MISAAETPDGPAVVLNDPGDPTGQGALVDAAEFEDAWEHSGRLIVSAESE